MQMYLDSKQSKREFTFNLAGIIEDKLPVIVCIGSDRVVSDMIGPLTAEILVNKYDVDTYVYGRLDNPIVAKNLKSAFRYIKAKHNDRKIVVIDATLGKVSDIGMVKLIKSGCIPAGGFGAQTAVYGDISILPVVSACGVDAKMFLSATRFLTVYRMAKDIAECVNNAIKISKQLSGLTI
jgi:putative sporulation protein YyaC